MDFRRAEKTVRIFLGILLLLFALAACTSASSSAAAGGGKPGAPGAGARDRAVPVTTAAVAQRDVPIYLDGLGSVTAYKSVTVRSQVDGRLDQVSFKEGQEVKRGQVLAQIDPRPFQIQLHQAEGQLERDQGALDPAKLDLVRYEDLVKKSLASQQQLDAQHGLVSQAEGAVRIDRAAIEAARLNLDYARIVSPIDGVTGIRQVDPGNLIHAADPTGVVVVAQLDPIAVIFTLPQDALPQIAEQQARGPLDVVVYSRDASSELGRGKLEVIDNAIIASTATLRLKAVLANPTHALWPNQFVKTRLMLAVRQGVIVIPAAAIQRGPEGSFVYIVGPDQTVQPRPIVLDLLQGDEALIAKGLEAGETVVTEGQNQLRPGAKISLRTAGGKGAAGEAGEGGQPGKASAGATGGKSEGEAGEGATPGGGRHRRPGAGQVTP